MNCIRIPSVGNITYPSYLMGRPDSVSFPGGTRDYRYDALLRTTNITAPGMNYSYPLYDNAGNILTKQTEHGTYGYGYDDLYRLTGANAPAANETYDYDPVGNRLSAPGVVGPIQHNQNNELRQYGGTSFDYDANGNLTSQTSATVNRQFIYNVPNRLVRVEENNQVIAEYGYDPFGRRLWKDVSGTRTYFLYSDEGLTAEYDAAGNELRSYGYRPDSTWSTDPLWLQENGNYYWYQNGHLGTPQKLVDSVGTVVWSATYSAFGEASINTETITNNLRFPGQYVDAETEWHYNFHRYYDPGTGRYTQVDPIGFEGDDENLYAYVWNNGINFIDPLGLKAQLKGTAEEKARLLELLRNIGGTAFDVDTQGNISPDFPRNDEFAEIQEWLRILLDSEKQFTIQFDDVFQVGSFKFGEVKLDYDFMEEGLCEVHYWEKKSVWDKLWEGSSWHYFTGEGVLAHELFGHGLDWESGDAPGSIRGLSKKEKNYWEKRAIDKANKVRDLLGIPLRAYP